MKKHLRRILSAMLSVVIVLTSFELPITISDVFASDDYVPYGSTDDVPETPETLMNSGEWLYFVFEGKAYIAGYQNLQEEELKVPAHLGGYPVVGIGHEAFIENVSLVSIELHNNITHIAKDSFADRDDIIIRAYNGSFASYFSFLLGYNEQNLSESPNQELTERVIDMSGAPAGSYYALSESQVTVKTEDNSYLSIGDVIYFPPQESYTTGLAGKINAINCLGDTSTILFSQPEFGEVFSEIKGTDLAYVDWEKANLAEGVYLDDINAAVKGSFSGSKWKLGINFGSLKFPGSFNKFSISGNIGLSVGAATVTYDIGLKNLFPDAKLIQVDLPITTSESVSFKYKHKITDASKGTGRLVNRMTIVKDVPFASMGGVINGYMAVDLIVELNGELKFSTTTEVVHTFKIQNGKGSYSKSKNTYNNSIEASGEFKIGPQLSLYLVLGWSGFSIRFLEVNGGIFVIITGKFTATAVTGSQSFRNCGDISLKVQIEVGCKIGIVKVLNKNGIYASLSREFKLYETPTCHIEDLKLVKTCTLKNRAIIWDFMDKGKSGIKITYANVNQLITPPSEPTRKGYVFKGWYVSKSASGLSGSDGPWNFSTQRMPYISKADSDGVPNKGALYLYAKWKSLDPTKYQEDDKFIPSRYSGGSNTGGVGSGGGSGGGGSTSEWIVYPLPTVPPTATPTPCPVPVKSITLNKTSAEFYKGDTPGTIQLSATVSPSNADDRSVVWESSNDSIAYANESGLVKIGNSGVATITCRSVNSPEVTATCTITVKQKVEEVYISSETNSIVPGETMQLMVQCFPENALNKKVTWSSANANIATVNSSGLVTGVAYGDAVIKAVAVDGSNTEGLYKVKVEKELALDQNVINDTLYLQGEESCTVAYVNATNSSIRRMKERGYELSWSVASSNSKVSASLETINTTVVDKGQTYDSTLALILVNDITAAGQATLTVTCTAGSYSATSEISITVLPEEYASSVKLNNTTITTDVNTPVILPAAPVSKDSNPVPDGLSMFVEGDRYYDSAAVEEETSDGLTITFMESGIYETTVCYRKANLVYQVPVSFYVRDEDGTIHLKVTEISLDNSFVDMVEGETIQLACEIEPADAYNRDVLWKSEDETIAVVSQNGTVTALKAGSVMVYAESQDGSESYGSCAVRVESFLNLDEEVVERTVYLSGDARSDIETVNVTYLSQKRLTDEGLNVNWKLEHISGDSTELAMQEYRSLAEEGIAISGNRLKLIRMNGTGEDEYLLSCTAGNYSDTCRIRITVEEGDLPTSATLSKTTYTGSVGSAIAVDTTPVFSPSGTSLPENTEIVIDGTNAFRKALSTDYDFTEPDQLIFEKGGIFSAWVIFSGANYSYRCPITVRVEDEDGNVPPVIESVMVDPQEVTLRTGESITLSGLLTPADAPHSQFRWRSLDTSIVTVSSNGVVTAIDAGITGIVLSVPESDMEDTCFVIVEDGLTLEKNSLERTVFVDGTTRTDLDVVLLSEASSVRLDESPEWTLKRVSGNNLTLRAYDYETLNEKGDKVYGSRIQLYSVSAKGDTVYTLTAKSGDETAVATITVHAVSRDSMLPAVIELSETVFTADVDELIVMQPEVSCWPSETEIPAGVKVTLEGDRQFTAAVNTDDYYVSQSISTVSFTEPGTFYADCIYSYSNVKYTIPLTFRIRNSEGEVPVLAKMLKLSNKTAFMVAGDTLTLDAVFEPAGTTDQQVVWSSSNNSVATVTQSGVVRAIKNGTAVISCTPSDTHVDVAKCYVTVEDYFTIEAGASKVSNLYLQGDPVNALSTVNLSTGTMERLATEDISPEWELVTTGATHAVLVENRSEDGKFFYVNTAALLSEGTDTYTIRCTAGSHEWSQNYTLNVMDQGSGAPQSIEIENSTVTAAVGSPVTLNFAPVMTPQGASLPAGMDTYYVGIGEFYNAIDDASFESLENASHDRNGNNVTITFTKPGSYILTRQYLLENLHYTTACTVSVGDSGQVLDLLEATETEYTVYTSGKSGIVSTISVKDTMITQEWGSSMLWDVERISGNSITAVIKSSGGKADLYVADVERDGTDVWRISCTFGGITDSIDIILTAKTPNKSLPDSVELMRDNYKGVIGNWITVPLGVVCTPLTSALPDTGDDFWIFAFDGQGEDTCDYLIQNNSLQLNFTESGYYKGKLTYSSGNVSYVIPLFFTVADEEGIVTEPNMNLFLTDMAPVVYPEGETGIPIGKVIAAESLSTYSVGRSAAYMAGQDAAWSINITGGSAAQLSLRWHSDNVYDVILTGIKSTGDVNYKVTCILNQKTLTANGSLHVALDTESRPDATLKRTTYVTEIEEPILIDRSLYSRINGSMLQSSTSWNAEGILSAMGYTYQETQNQWLATFYKEGTYHSSVTGYVGNLAVEVPLTITVFGKNGSAPMNILKFPKALSSIDEESFMAVSSDIVDLRGTNVKRIGSGAFKNCVDLKIAYLPEEITSIGENAFYGCLNLVIYCKEGSVADIFAKNNGFVSVYY